MYISILKYSQLQILCDVYTIFWFFHFQGVTKRPLTLRAVQDSVLEGEERFDLTIVSVTYDAEISPIQGTVSSS